jgi:hypothetical protein
MSEGHLMIKVLANRDLVANTLEGHRTLRCQSPRMSKPGDGPAQKLAV